MEKVKVGVVGAGYFGEFHARVFAESILAELTAIIDVNQDRAKTIAKRYHAKSWYTSVHDMLKKEDIDAISVVTRENQHKAPVIAAAEAGKHVFVEKPIAHTLEDAKRMIDTTQKHKVKFMVGYLLRFDPRYAEGKRQVDDGMIGEILSVWAKRAGKFLVAQRVAKWTNPQFYMSVHDIDLLNWYVNSEVDRVYAESSVYRLDEKAIPCVVLALLRFKNGVTGSLETNWSRPLSWKYPLESRLHVSGTKGVVYVDVYDQGLKIFTETDLICPDTIHWPVTQNKLMGALREELTHFLECILLDKDPIVSGEDGIKSLQVALAITDSLETGTVIHL